MEQVSNGTIVSEMYVCVCIQKKTYDMNRKQLTMRQSQSVKQIKLRNSFYIRYIMSNNL